MDCSLPGYSIHGIFQARILEWVAISFTRGSSQPKDQTCVSCIGRWTLPLSHLGSPVILFLHIYPVFQSLSASKIVDNFILKIFEWAKHSHSLKIEKCESKQWKVSSLSCHTFASIQLPSVSPCVVSI